MPSSITTRRRKLCLPVLALAYALALAGCSSKADEELDARIARAEAAAARAEGAQKAAEAAAARAENDKIAAASNDVDFAKPEPAEAARDEPESDASANQTTGGNPLNTGPG